MNSTFKNEELGIELTIKLDEKNEPLFLAGEIALALWSPSAIRKGVAYSDMNKLRNALGIRNSVSASVIMPKDYITKKQVYQCLFKSNSSIALDFQNWLIDEVLPSIEKHGAYMTDQTIEDMLTDPDLLIQLATTLKGERIMRIEAEEKAEQAKIEAEKTTTFSNSILPYAKYARTLIDSDQLLTTTQIAKDLMTSATALNRWLNKLGVIYKVGGQWVLYAKYDGCGYCKAIQTQPDITGNSYRQLKWTEKGRVFILGLYKKHFPNQFNNLPINTISNSYLDNLLNSID